MDGGNSLRTGKLPPLQNGKLAWEEDMSDLTAVAADKLIPTTSGPEGKRFCLRMKLITANVQSANGKTKYFEQQLLHKNVNVFLCQEAKGREGCIRAKHFFRYSSNSEGVWGTEVWINRSAPLATLDGDPVYVQEADVSVVGLGPRHIHLVVSLAGQKIHLASLHIPQQNRDIDERHAMMECLRNIAQMSAQHWLFIGTDANPRVPGQHDMVTGNAVLKEADAAGVHFVGVLQQEQLWLPNAYEEVHSGPVATWVHPTGKRSQIDFLVTNHNLRRCSIQSHVCDDFDLLNTRDDHFPLEMQIEQTVAIQHTVNKKLRRGLDLDLRALDCPDVKCRFERALDWRKCDNIPWSVDVNTHAALIEDGILAALREVLPRKCETPKSNYIPEDAWAVRSKKLRFKQLTADRKQNFRPGVLSLTWRLLKGAFGVEAAVLSWLLNKLILLHEIAALAVKFATLFMRERVKVRKNEIMAQFADGLGKVQPDQILRQVKNLGLGKRTAVPWKRCLPRLADSNGQTVVGRGSLDELWLEVFGSMELGVVKPTDEFIAEACTRVQKYVDFDPELNALPTFSEVETVIRNTTKGKASGLDRIPGEALRKAPGRIASIYFPLMLKAATGLHQSIQWRGGILAECYKQAGSQRDTASYRSLFVSSVPGKAYHRLLRGKIAADTEECLADTHFGIRRGASVVIPSQIIVLFQKWQRKTRKPCSIVFLDTRSAYYRVVRQFAYGDADADSIDSHTQRVMKHFDLPNSDWYELLEMVKTGGLMATANIGAHLRALIADCQHFSWFTTRFSNGTKVCHTSAGSRPGESLADSIYAFILHKVMTRIKAEALEENLDVQVLFSGVKFFEASDAGESVRLDGPIWADDVSFVVTADDPGNMIEKTKHLTGKILDACRSHGMSPNLKKGKTAIMLCIRGKGCKKVQSQIFGTGAETLEVPTRNGLEPVFLMPTYVHLGCAIDKEMGFESEAHRRVAAANTAFNAYQRIIFQNRAIPLATRGSMLAIFVESTFFNAELWNEHVKRGTVRFARAFKSFSRECWQTT